MRPAVVVYYVGFVLAIDGLFMLASALVGFGYGEVSAMNLLVAGMLSVGVGAFPLIFIPRITKLTPRETVLIVVGAWIVSGIAGAVPFYLYGSPFTLVNALFESISGFTTTGSSVLTQVEVIPKGLLFWRSATQWIGGVGIIVFMLAILPALGHVGHLLLRREYTSLTSQPLPRARDIARVVVQVYLGLTVLETVALLLCGVNLFEAVTTSFTTTSTGGYSPRDGSIAAYNSLAVELVVLVFMILSGINFALLYELVFMPRRANRGWTPVWLYFAILGVGTILTTNSLHGKIYDGWFESLRYASFQAASLASSTGFATTDTAIWTPSCHIIIIIYSLICATAGSTTSGIKTDRFVVFLKLASLRFKQLIHPTVVPSIRIEGRVISADLADRSVFYIVLYLMIVTIAALLISLMGVGTTEAFSGAVATMGNVGPGLGEVGSMGSFAGQPDLAKLIHCALMLLGRLEILVLVIPFTRGFWKA